MKKFYLYDSAGLFTTDYDAQENPRRPGQYITPELATELVPITVSRKDLGILSPNEVDVFNGQLWTIDDDFRGVVYDTATGNQVSHDAIGPLPNGRTLIPKPSELHSWGSSDWVLDAVKVRSAKALDLSQACENQIIAGVDCAALGSVHTYPSTRNDQNFLSARFAKAQALGASGEPYSFKCQDAAGVWSRVDHTAAQIIAVGLAVDAHITESLNHLDTKMAALAAAGDDLVALDAVVW